MEILISWEGARPKNLPYADLEDLEKLFAVWGLPREKQNLIFLFVFTPPCLMRAKIDDKDPCLGLYEGEKCGRHFIRINKNLLKRGERREFYQTVIHELRHAYWHIVTGSKNLDSRLTRKEQNDCMREEAKYSKFKPLTFS